MTNIFTELEIEETAEKQPQSIKRVLFIVSQGSLEGVYPVQIMTNGALRLRAY